MRFGSWLVAVAVACLAPPASASVVQFAAPAGNLPAGRLRGAVYDAVLPSGRLVTPFGENIVVGTNALGMTLTPDGRYVVVSNDDERGTGTPSAVDPSVRSGYSLAVVDTETMHVVDRFAVSGETFFAGVSAVPDPLVPARTLIFAAGGADNAVAVLDLDANGRLTPDGRPGIPIPGPLDPGFADLGHSFPGSLVAARDGRHIYVVNEGGASIAAIDTATRALAGAGPAVGFFPFGAALAGDRLLVSAEGLTRYANLADARSVPRFGVAAFDPQRSSVLTFVPLAADGTLGTPEPSLGMDGPPDGVRIIGAAHPTAVAVTPDNAYAFVAMTNVDRIATVRLGTAPAVIGGTELRLFDRGPYGTQPAAVVLSGDGTRLYVALAGLNAVAVLDARDPAHLHRLGLIPTGWYPSALALSHDDRTLYVVDTKGFGHDGAPGDPGSAGGEASPVWSTLQKIDLATVRLSETTLTTLKNTRETHATEPVYPPALRNVVVILEADTTFDAMLGDLGYGPADPSHAQFGESVTPNLHALARRYAVAGNLFADAPESGAFHQFLTGGIATAYTVRTMGVTQGRGALANAADDPEDYPRAGYLFDALARRHVSFRDYGDLLRLPGSAGGDTADPQRDDPDFISVDDRRAPTHGLGRRFASDVPAPAVLAGNIDLDYPGPNPRIRNERRAREFVRDYSVLVRAHHQPRYTHIWLPADRPQIAPDLPSAAEGIADGDRAVGTIVQYLSRLASWKNTVVFVLPDTARSGQDHVDPQRAYALVISPFAKRHFVGMQHLSTASVLKTTEQILRVPSLALGDLLASDMSNFFTAAPDARPFTALAVPTQP